MPQNILSSPQSQPVFIAINEVSGNRCWKNLKILDVEVGTSAANTNKPVATENLTETQTYESIIKLDVKSIKVIQPSTLRITAIAPDIDTLEGVLANFADNRVTMSINTKSIITQSLVVTAVDVEQMPDMISASRINISLEQAQPPQFSSYDPEQAGDASIYGSAIVVPPIVPLSLSSLFGRTMALFQIDVVPTVDGALIDYDGGPFILDVSKLA